MAPHSRIEKSNWKPGNVLSPVPAVLVSCGGSLEWKPNLITIAWTGSICSEPPMLSISVRPERYSYDIIQATGEFAVNVPSLRQAKATDWCGMVSGRDVDKFSNNGLTPAPAVKVQCPIVLQLPVIECRVKEALKLGSTYVVCGGSGGCSGDVFSFKHKREGFAWKGPACWLSLTGKYFALGRIIGRFGFSVKKRKRKNRR